MDSYRKPKSNNSPKKYKPAPPPQSPVSKPKGGKDMHPVALWLLKFIVFPIFCIILTWSQCRFTFDTKTNIVCVEFFNQESWTKSFQCQVIDKNGNLIPVKAAKINVMR